mgnify:CR=1 FL=1
MSKFNWNYPTTMWVGQDRINDVSLACKSLNINPYNQPSVELIKKETKKFLIQT